MTLGAAGMTCGATPAPTVLVSLCGRQHGRHKE
jgi:hypothetical protein